MGLFEYFERFFGAGKSSELVAHIPLSVEPVHTTGHKAAERSVQDERFEAHLAQEVASAREEGRSLIAGSIEVLGLDDIKQEAGGDWNRISAEVRRIAEQEISRALGPTDLYRAYNDASFALCFVSLPESDAKARTRAISKQVKSRIAQELPASSKKMSVTRFVTEVPTEDFSDDQPLTESLIASMSRLNTEARQAARNYRRRLLKDFQVLYAPVWSPADERTHMNRCVLDLSLGCSSLGHFRAIADPDEMASTLADLDQLVVTRAIETLHHARASGEQRVLIVPMSYQTLNFHEDRGEFLNLLAAVPNIYRDSFIIELTALPSDINRDDVLATCQTLRPFAERLVVEVNGRPDLVDAELAEVGFGIAWNLYGSDHTHLPYQKAVIQTLERAAGLGLQSFAQGANTIGLAVAAADVGFTYIDGPAVHLFSTEPKAPGRLLPVKYQERVGAWS